MDNDVALLGSASDLGGKRKESVVDRGTRRVSGRLLARSSGTLRPKRLLDKRI